MTDEVQHYIVLCIYKDLLAIHVILNEPTFVSHKIKSYLLPWCKNCNSVKGDDGLFRRTNISKFQYSLQ
jgi:hypothetical protein